MHRQARQAESGGGEGSRSSDTVCSVSVGSGRRFKKVYIGRGKGTGPDLAEGSILPLKSGPVAF